MVYALNRARSKTNSMFISLPPSAKCQRNDQFPGCLENVKHEHYFFLIFYLEFNPWLQIKFQDIEKSKWFLTGAGFLVLIRWKNVLTPRVLGLSHMGHIVPLCRSCDFREDNDNKAKFCGSRTLRIWIRSSNGEREHEVSVVVFKLPRIVFGFQVSNQRSSRRQRRLLSAGVWQKHRRSHVSIYIYLS